MFYARTIKICITKTTNSSIHIYALQITINRFIIGLVCIVQR